MAKKTLDLLNAGLRKSFSKAKNRKVIPESCSNGTVKFSEKANVTLNAKVPSEAEDSNEAPLAYYQLFRYSTISERVLILLGLLFTLIGAFGVPFVIIMYGEYSTLLIDRTLGIGTSTKTGIISIFGGGRIITNGTSEENKEALIEDSGAFSIGCLVVTLISFVTCAVGIDLINYTAIKQINRIRIIFLKAILQQDMAWFDTTTNNNFATKITDDLEKLKEGIAEKFGMFTYLIMNFIINIVFALIYGWKLALTMISCAPFIVITTALVTRLQRILTEKELNSYSFAGAVAEEVLSGIRTVVAFGGEQKECIRFSERLRPAEESGKKKGLYTGIGNGLLKLVMYCCYALAFWYGTRLIIEDRPNIDKEYTPAILIIVLFGVLTAARNLGYTSPLIETFSTACGAGASVFSIIERKPIINSLDSSGLKPNQIVGDIEFDNVHFEYPARKDEKILLGLNLTIQAGQTIALVGSSGCGKSTCLQLLQRLYDPNGGCVLVDGIKINELNTAWLRSNIGVVGQEPVLFATTIGENIQFGNPNATQEEIISAAISANCHEFIIKLPNGYNTMVGEKGAHLSGGQKQRIAIARALVRNPKILLLDEATSALDPTSERVVQDALEKATEGRTTLVVSHRLSTITNSDKIVFIQDGIVKEEGNHRDLMTKMGLYYDLVKATSAHENEVLITQMKTTAEEAFDEIQGPLKSDDTREWQNLAENATEKDKAQVSFWRILKLNSPEWKVNLIGCIASVLQGASIPVYSILFAEFYGILSRENSEEVLKQSNIFSIMFVALGIFVCLTTFLETYMFNIASVRLTSRLRQTSLKTMLSQKMEWFDDHKNSTGQLCARLSGDCASVQGAAGSRLGTMLQSCSTLAVGIVISFYLSWDLTLVSMVLVPIVLGSAIFESRYTVVSSLNEKLTIEDASNLAIEAISNIRTVASLGQEPHVLERFTTEINKASVSSWKKSRLRGIVFSFGQSSPSLAYCIAFYYGGIKVAEGELHYKTLIKITEILIFGTWVLGQALAYAPNVSAAILSAGRIIKLLDSAPKISNFEEELTNENVKKEGHIEYKDVLFHYPTRRQVPVLQGLNLNIPKGSTVALVGPSGCGKSTCMQLLLRYYDPDDGSIDLDKISTIDYRPDRLRSQLGLVSQEPILFDRTIAENIAYGDNSRDVPMNEIINAAKEANIHEFITNLSMGYETRLGSKGVQLSGGQKQRIAIARALVRNPRVLLLDEATSALDTHSEKVVQSALDAARTGRTCIMIAHRLTTVQNADLICVIQGGVVIEKGTHLELMKLGQVYAKLFSMQHVS